MARKHRAGKCFIGQRGWRMETVKLDVSQLTQLALKMTMEILILRILKLLLA
jgi:hypothetical protein